jgi:hypothetical protein
LYVFYCFQGYQPVDYDDRKRNLYNGAIRMLDFDRYVTRHGEFGAQALIERLERYEGVSSYIGNSLEDRWNMLMQGCPTQQRLAA